MRRPVTRREKAAWAVCGRLLVWLAKAAERRGDWHEVNHVLLQLKVGNSSHDKRAWPCKFPASSHDGILPGLLVEGPDDEAAAAASGGETP